MNSQQVMYGVDTMDAVIADSLAPRRFSMILLGIFACWRWCFRLSESTE